MRVLLAAAALLAVASAGGAGAGTPSPPLWAALAPVVYLHGGEQFLPVDPDGFVSGSELRWNHDGGCPDERLAGSGDVEPASLGRRDGRYSARRTRPAYRGCVRHGPRYAPTALTRPFDDRSETGAEGFFLAYGGSPHGELGGSWPVLYEHVPGRYLAYWFFYARSSPVKATVADRVRASRWVDTLGRHQGDWEHVTIRLRGTEPVAVAFYSHGSPRILPWSAVEREGGRLVVYSAQGSHASYSAPSSERGERRCIRNVGCLVDRTERSPRRWETWRLLSDARAKPWYGFGGAWGSIGPWYRAEGVVGRRRETAGPLGPSRWKRELAPAGW